MPPSDADQPVALARWVGGHADDRPVEVDAAGGAEEARRRRRRRCRRRAATSQYPRPLGVGAMPTIGWLRLIAPVEPKKRGVAEGEDAAVGGDQPVPRSGRHGGDRDDRRVQREVRGVTVGGGGTGCMNGSGGGDGPAGFGVGRRRGTHDNARRRGRCRSRKGNSGEHGDRHARQQCTRDDAATHAARPCSCRRVFQERGDRHLLRPLSVVGEDRAPSRQSAVVPRSSGAGRRGPRRALTFCVGHI